MHFVHGSVVWDGGWMPLPTRPQRYCDPASIVPLLDSIITTNGQMDRLIDKTFYEVARPYLNKANTSRSHAVVKTKIQKVKM